MAVARPTGDQKVTVQVGDQKRTCVVHLPPAYDGTRPLPLVIVIHGSGGSGAGMASYTGLNALADKEGFIAAYPDNLAAKGRGWSALFGKPIPGGHGAQTDEVDDVGFIRNLIDHLHQPYHTDPLRVFVCGHSSGAYMAYRVAIGLSDRVAAAGVVNGSMAIRLLDGQPSIPEIPSPAAPVSIIHICGAKDGLVKFAGGKTQRVIARSVPECIQHFVKANGCDATGKETNDAGVTRTVHTGGKDATEVKLVVVENCGHEWPTAKDGLSANQELWEFFSAHPRRPAQAPASRSSSTKTSTGPV